MTTPVAQSVDILGSGRTSTAPFITVIFPRAPSPLDGINNAYLVGQRWVDSLTDQEYFLLNFISFAGSVTANWIQLGGGIFTTETLTGNDGVPVPPTANNINVIGAPGINFTGSGSTLTATLTPFSGAWVDVTTNMQALVAGTGYIVDNGGSLVTFTLPATATYGDTYIIQGKSSGGWQVNVGAGQIINVSGSATTITTGHVASSNQWDAITINCVTPNTIFACRAYVGNLTVV